MSSENWKTIKESITIPDLLKRMGLPHEFKRNKICCPIHQEKTPSFNIYDGGRRFKCFGCGAGSDVGDLYQALTQCDRKQAYRDLCEMLNLDTGSGFGALWGQRQSTTLPRVDKKLENRNDFNPPKLSYQNKELWLWAARKNIHQDVIYQALMDGDLDLEDGKMVFIYNTGRKKRFDWNSSRENRWIEGGAEGGLWRYREVTNPNKHVIIMLEGESDAMRILSLLPKYIHPVIGVVAIPAASWVPDQELAMLIGMNRDVVLMFDNDNAGREASKRVHSIISTVPSCRVFQCMPSGAKDVCEENEEILRKQLDKILTLT